MLNIIYNAKLLQESVIKSKLFRKFAIKGKYFGSYTVIREPSAVLRSDPVPTYISTPSYAKDSALVRSHPYAEVKEEWQIIGMKNACRIARTILNVVGQNISPGITTEDIDVLVREESFKRDSYPSPLNYKGFPKSCCTSVNNVACHGIPDTRALVDGDIVSVDVTVFHKGFHGDCCETFLIGDVDEYGRHLVAVAKKCRDEAVSICGPGIPFCRIGQVIETIANEEGYCVVPAFIGHGIGQYFHGPPDIYHFSNSYPGLMEPGMTFTVEPVIAQGGPEAAILEDGWTAVMEDRGRAAQFEHTVLVTQNGRDILT